MAPNVKDIMTSNPTCCMRQDTAQQAAQAMRQENVGSIPVVEDQQNKRLIGIVTDRDLAMKVIAEGLDPRNCKVEEVMTKSPISCMREDGLEDVLNTMEENQIRRIPVVDRDNKIIGIIAQADIATRVNKPRKTAELVEEVSKS